MNWRMAFRIAHLALFVSPALASGQNASPVNASAGSMKLAFHVIEPTSRNSVTEAYKEFMRTNTGNPALQTSSEGADKLASYSTNAAEFARVLTSRLTAAFPPSEGWPNFELGIVCAYPGRSGWQRIADPSVLPDPASEAGVREVAAKVNIVDPRVINVIVAPIVVAPLPHSGQSLLLPVDGSPNPVASVYFKSDTNLRGEALPEGILASSHFFTRVLSRFDEGDFIVHEVGHLLGLEHPWHDSGPASCERIPQFDFPQHGARFGQTRANWSSDPPNGCGGPEPVHNYMSYTADSERREFSDRQKQLMKANLANRKSGNPTMVCRDNGVDRSPGTKHPNPPTNLTSQ